MIYLQTIFNTLWTIWNDRNQAVREVAATIKIDGKRNKKFRRSGHAYEAKNNEGTRMFVGCNSTGASTTNMAIQEALEASLQDKNLGCRHIMYSLAARTWNGSATRRKVPTGESQHC